MAVNENLVETNWLAKESLEKAESSSCSVRESPPLLNTLQVLPAGAAMKCLCWQAA